MNDAIMQFYAVRKRATEILKNAVHTGVLIRAKFCSQCGSTKYIQGHHEDYESPLLVEWLCCHCHHVRHKVRRYKSEADVRNGTCPCGCTFCFEKIA